MTVNIFETHTLLGAIKEAGIKFDPLFLRLFFKREVTFETKNVLLDLIPVDTPIALYCAPKVAGEVLDNLGYSTSSFTPPYIKPKHEVDVSDVMVRMAGESPIDSPMTMEDRREAKIMENLQKEERSIAQREEYQAVEAVLYGKIEASSDKHPLVEIDMGRSDDNNITLTDTDVWSEQDTSTYDPDEDIEEWAAYADGAINIIIMDKKAWALYRSFDVIKARQNQRRGTNSALETGLKDLGMAVSFKGETGTGVHIIVYEGEYTATDGTTTNYMPDNTIVLGHTAIEGFRLYGAIQNMKAVKEGMAQSSRYPRNWQTNDDPVAEYTQTEAAPAMYLPKPNQFVVIEVD